MSTQYRASAECRGALSTVWLCCTAQRLFTLRFTERYRSNGTRRLFFCKLYQYAFSAEGIRAWPVATVLCGGKRRFVQLVLSIMINDGRN